MLQGSFEAKGFVTMILSEHHLGQWFTVPWSPNPHKMVYYEARHCSLHGEYCWHEAGLIKRRNSQTRPWGGVINMVRADLNDVEPWIGPEPQEPVE